MQTEPLEPAVTAAGQHAHDAEGWIAALGYVARSYGLSLSPEAARIAARWSADAPLEARLDRLARSAGLRIKLHEPGKLKVSSWQLPVIVQMPDGQVGVVVGLSAGDRATVVFNGVGDLQTPIMASRLFAEASLIAVARPARSAPDARVDDYIRPYEKNWLKQLVFSNARSYGHVMLASFVANILALSTVVFSMQVYDRVVPAQSVPTLYVLFSGVLLAIVFDFLLRRARSSVVDVLGKHVDLRLSDRVMGHALRVKNNARPTSTGSFIAQIRDLEQVREMLTSTTVTALADLPFFVLFLGIFWVIAGWLVVVPIVALVAMVTPGLLAQGRIRRYAQQAMREGSLRNAVLVESIQGIEDIKTLQAEDRFQQQWNHLNKVTGEAQLKLRDLLNGLTNWTQSVQMGVFAVIVFLGAPMVIAGDMTTGALVAASILGSRMMAPMAQAAQLLSRVQHARVAAKSLDQIMQLPIDNPTDVTRVHAASLSGSFELRNAVFFYGEPSGAPALTVKELKIGAGEKIAVLGRNGAGKSTLLQALSGLLEPASGEVLIDGIAMQHLDTADLRREVGLLTQDSRLFYGSLRDNLLMGAPAASQEQIFAALSMVGATDFIRRLPKGLDHMVLEGGQGLSGGQKQALLLARLLLRQPSVVLLDEPTAAMDDESERHFIRNFAGWAEGRTAVIATHRMRVLELVDRIVVIDRGRITLDDAKDKALQKLHQLRGVPAATRKSAVQGG